jgi:hypothetical protein
MSTVLDNIVALLFNTKVKYSFLKSKLNYISTILDVNHSMGGREICYTHTSVGLITVLFMSF